MAILDTALDPRAPSYLENRSTAQAALSRLEAAHAEAREGGGEREVTRHHARGKLLPRERIELLVDRDTALLELAATAGHLSGEAAGAGLVTSIGIIERAQCMIVANDPTVRESGLSEQARHKAARAVELARLHDLPLVFLWESSVDARDVVAVHARNAVLTAVFGGCEEPLPLADHRIAVRGHGDIAAVDALAEDERDSLRLMRQAVRHLVVRGPAIPAPRAAVPRHDGDDLLAAGRYEVREVLARVLDGSDFDELRPHRGLDIVAGFGSVHSRHLAVLANCSAALESESINKGLEVIRLAGLAGLPLLVLANTSSSAELARALADVAQVTVLLGADPPDWALTSRGFRFSWPCDSEEYYDGVIDPRDTRTVVGICMSVMGGRV